MCQSAMHHSVARGAHIAALVTLLTFIAICIEFLFWFFSLPLYTDERRQRGVFG